MSRLHMQQAKERANLARRSRKATLRPVGADERIDLTNDNLFHAVPRGIDGVRLNRDSLAFELLRGDEVVETLNCSGLTLTHRLEVVEATLPPKRRNAFRRQLKTAHGELGKVIADHDWFQLAKKDVRALPEWEARPHPLQKPAKPCTAEIAEAMRNDRVVCACDLRDDLKRRFAETPPTPFLIEHDWAGAFSNAEDFASGDCPMPYDDVMFELAYGDRRVCLWTNETDDWMCRFISIHGGWLANGFKRIEPLERDLTPLDNVLSDQVYAVCIALDAEIAVKDVVRADEKLNRAREKRGKPPLLDYHVVRLSRRERAAPLERHDDGDRKHRSPRLHFVRGHWRRFSNHKTWIKWHLRGDPDLGFIDKHYRL